MSFQQGFEDVSRDVPDGVRSLAKRPGFTAVAVLSLALGIGANTAIFSLVNAIILRDSPIDRPEEVVNLYLHQASFAFSTFSYPDYEDVRDGTTEVFSNIGAAQIVPVQIDQAASPPPSPCFGVPSLLLGHDFSPYELRSVAGWRRALVCGPGGSGA